MFLQSIKKPSFITIVLILISITGIKAQNKSDIKVIDVSRYHSLLNEINSDKFKIVSFWATWCKPCLKELPELVRFNNNNRDISILLLISLDEESRFNAAAKIINRIQFNGPAILLEASDQELTQIYEGWTGAVPFTLLYDENNYVIQSIDKEITYEELTNILKH